MKTTKKLTKSKRGRPLSFDRKAALEKALYLFWNKGYAGTSLNDLTEALGVTPPSIYAAFGDKKKLFLEVVDLYVGGDPTASAIIDNAKDSRSAAEEMLRMSAKLLTGDATPPGCLLANAALSCAKEAEDIRDYLAKIRTGTEKRLSQKILKDIASGRLPKDTDGSTLAAYTVDVIHGMSTLARDGASRAKLLRIADLALKCWPA